MSGVSLARPDITLHIDDHGVIREASFSDSIGNEGGEAWVGQPWLDTVSGNGDSLVSMLEDARTSGVSAFRSVMQRMPSGREMFIEYTTVRDPGRRGGLLAMGKNLQVMAELQSRLASAQQATEREYWKLRDVETRYRLLFDTSNEAVLMVGGDDLRIVEANPTAVRALGSAPGWDLGGNLLPKERAAFTSMLQRVREHGRAPGIVVHMGPGMAPWAVRASLMAGETEHRYLLHVSAGSAPQDAAAPVPIETIIDRLPDGFVLVSVDGTILRANQAFLDQIQVGALGAVRGELLGRWLCKPGADASILLATMQRYQSVKLFQSTLYGDLGSEISVEVSAAGSTEQEAPLYGLIVRDVSRRSPESQAADLPALIDTLSEQLGQVPLLDMVRTATEMVERRLIKDALDRVGGNRTAAAELLGLSRQSLHIKLNRQAATDESEQAKAAE